MTPDQTEIILEEYVEMNRTPDEAGNTRVDLAEMKSESEHAASLRPKLSAEGQDLADRVKAEMREKLGKVSAQIQG